MKEEELPNKEESIVVPLCYTTLYKITSKRGLPLYKGQKAGSQVCPLFGGSTLLKQSCVVPFIVILI